MNLIDPRNAQLVGIANFALSASRPTVAVRDAFEYRKEAFDLRPQAVNLVEVAILIPIEPFDEFQQRFAIRSALISKPALLDRNDCLDATFGQPFGLTLAERQFGVRDK